LREDLERKYGAFFDEWLKELEAKKKQKKVS